MHSSCRSQDAIERAIGRARALREKVSTNAKKAMAGNRVVGIRSSQNPRALAPTPSPTPTPAPTIVNRRGRVDDGGSKVPASQPTKAAGSRLAKHTRPPKAGKLAAPTTTLIAEPRPVLSDIKLRLPTGFRKTAGKLAASVQHLHAAAASYSQETEAFLRQLGGSSGSGDGGVLSGRWNGAPVGSEHRSDSLMTAERVTAGYRCLTQCLSTVSLSDWRLLTSSPTPGTLMQQYRLSCLTRAVIEESARLDAIADAILAKATAAATVAGTLHNANGCTDGGDGRGVRSAYAVLHDHTASVRAILDTIEQKERVRAVFAEGAPERWLAPRGRGTDMVAGATLQRQQHCKLAQLSASERYRRDIECPSSTISYTNVEELLRIDMLRHEVQVLAVQIETEFLLRGVLDTVEAMPSAETPAAGEKTMAAIYRTIVRLRSNHGREPVFVLAV